MQLIENQYRNLANQVFNEEEYYRRKGRNSEKHFANKKKYSTFAHVLTDNKINYIYFKTFK